MASNSQTQSYRGSVTVAVDAWLENETDTTVVIAVQTRVWGSSYGPAQYGVVGQSGYDGDGAANWAEVGRGVLNYGATVVNGTHRFTVNKKNYSWTASCWAKAWGETVNGYGALPLNFEVRCNLTIPARTLVTQGNPSLSVSSNHCEVGGTVKLSWAKASSQGNASFDRFELWQGNNKLYSGSGTSYSVTPSSATGSGGGTATYTLKEIHEWYGSYPTTQASVSVAVRGPHGNPTLSASKTTANYGESVNLSWAKSSTQGNAAFARFELWQGNNKLYSGSAVSKSVVPSDATGPKGGTATYVLKEIHEWYGSYPTTQTSKSITVRSGVVSVYDSGGAKHTGLVTAYDSSGKSHYVLITAYDSSGKAHSVV